jgi:hypothetical protein
MRFLWVVIFLVCGLAGFSQTPVTVNVCAGSSPATISALLAGNLAGCGNNPVFTVSGSTVTGVANGVVTAVNVTSAGNFDVVVQNGANTCQELDVTVNYIQPDASFVLTSQSGCFGATLDANLPPGAGISYSYTIEGTPLPNADVNGTIRTRLQTGERKLSHSVSPPMAAPLPARRM